jgi:hypothetical protein
MHTGNSPLSGLGAIRQLRSPFTYITCSFALPSIGSNLFLRFPPDIAPLDPSRHFERTNTRPCTARGCPVPPEGKGHDGPDTAQPRPIKPNANAVMTHRRRDDTTRHEIATSNGNIIRMYHLPWILTTKKGLRISAFPSSRHAGTPRKGLAPPLCLHAHMHMGEQLPSPENDKLTK